MKRHRQGWRILVTAGLIVGISGCATHPSPSASGGAGTVVASTVTTGPIMGYLWDQNEAGLRPIVGVPGAGYLGPPMFSTGAYTAATACSAKKFALLTGTKGDISIASLPAGAPLQLAPQLSPTQQMAISPGCTVALVYAAGNAQMLLVQGLPASPVVKTVEFAGSKQIVSAAVADSGAILVAALQPGGAVAVDAIRADGTRIPSLASLSAFGGFAFLPNADGALIADAGKNTVSIYGALDPNSTVTQIAGGADGVAQPMAIAASADGKLAVVLNGGSSILRLDLSKKIAPQKLSCNCSASQLTPLSGNLVFRLNETNAGPLWAFDGDAATPRVVFIPGAQHASLTGAVK